MQILRAKPSLRDSKNYLASFGARSAQDKKPKPGFEVDPFVLPPPASSARDSSSIAPTTQQPALTTRSNVLDSILDPVTRHTALVKLQGPFTPRQLSSIAQGMVYLEKLGLVSVIVLESDAWHPDGQILAERSDAIQETMDVVQALESHGAKARPIVDAIVRMGPKKGEELLDGVLEAHTLDEDLHPIRSALRAGDIPVVAPFALNSRLRSVRVSSNCIISALARGMVEAGEATQSNPTSDIDLTPFRLMIINREGGIPSYARAGLPHLLVNLDSEHDFIRDTYHPPWLTHHPTALSNLSLARTCLNYMPPTSSALMVSHRSKSSLIGNLITNRPAISSSLPHALLQGTNGASGSVTPDTPTLLRRGLPIRVIKQAQDLDKEKLTELLERSFNRRLNRESFFPRLEKSLDFVIVAGDYVGAAIVTTEPDGPDSNLTYLDKFAVLPQNQGDGTVDFLWVALHDESYGLGLPYSVNPNGGNQGQGQGRDLVWRSRANNPINKWYFERSSGHIRKGDWVMFWCDAEARLKDVLKNRAESTGRSKARLSYVEDDEVGRVERWWNAVGSIPSVWA